MGLPPLTCADLSARGLSNIHEGSIYYRAALDINGDGIACETNLTDYRIVNHKKCHLVDGSWVPVTIVSTPPCPTACPSTQPTGPVIVQSPPVTIPGPAPAPLYLTPAVPSGPAATGR